MLSRVLPASTAKSPTSIPTSSTHHHFYSLNHQRNLNHNHDHHPLTQAPLLVFPGLFLGNAVAADSHHLLQYLGVTHVVNAAEVRHHPLHATNNNEQLCSGLSRN